MFRKYLIKTGEAHVCELRMVKRDGVVFWARLAATEVQVPSLRSETTYISVNRLVMSDITEYKLADEKLKTQFLQFHQSKASIVTDGVVKGILGMKVVQDE